MCIPVNMVRALAVVDEVMYRVLMLALIEGVKHIKVIQSSQYGNSWYEDFFVSTAD